MALLAPRLTRREKLLLGVLAALVLATAIYLGAWRPYAARTSTLTAKLQAQEEQLAEAQAVAAREKALDAQLKEAREALAQIQTQIPGGADEIGLLCYLQLSAQDAGLVVGALRLTQGVAEGAYFRRNLALEAGGPYPAHLRFLHLLEAMPRLVAVERVWLGRNPPPRDLKPPAEDGAEVFSAAAQAASPAGCALAWYTFNVFTDPALKDGWARLRVPDTEVGRLNPFALP